MFLQSLGKLARLSNRNVNLNFSVYRELRRIARPLGQLEENPANSQDPSKPLTNPPPPSNVDSRTGRLLVKVKENPATSQDLYDPIPNPAPPSNIDIRIAGELVKLGENPVTSQDPSKPLTKAPPPSNVDSRIARNLEENPAPNQDLSKPLTNPPAPSTLDSSLDEIPDSDLPALPKTEKTYVPTFNLAAYINDSESLQQLLKLGVDLNSIERRKGLAEFVLKLKFDENVKPHLTFLHDLGVEPGHFGEFITKNPLIFKEDLQDLEVRVNYLQSKKFSPTQITRIVSKNPFWLMFSTKRIDRRLGYFQENFKLKGDEVRYLASKQPRLITYNMEHIRKSTFCVREEMGFEMEEMRCLLLNKPKLWMLNSDELIERFSYAHNEMKLSHQMIIQFPEILLSRQFRIRERHEFLELLGRAQYDPTKDLYVSPKTLVEGNDREFVANVAKCDMHTYEMFLKTR